jgi:hypothetical protein
MKNPENSNAKIPQVIEGEVLTKKIAPLKRLALTNARAIRREMVSVYEDLRRGQMDNDTARTSAFVLRCVLESIRLDEVEQRLSELEKQTS